MGMSTKLHCWTIIEDGERSELDVFWVAFVPKLNQIPGDTFKSTYKLRAKHDKYEWNIVRDGCMYKLKFAVESAGTSCGTGATGYTTRLKILMYTYKIVSYRDMFSVVVQTAIQSEIDSSP